MKKQTAGQDNAEGTDKALEEVRSEKEARRKEKAEQELAEERRQAGE